MHRDSPDAAVAVTLADWIEGLPGRALPAAVTRAVADSLIDTVGLAFAARGADYVAAVRKSWTGTGPSTNRSRHSSCSLADPIRGRDDPPLELDYHSLMWTSSSESGHTLAAGGESA